MSEEKKQALELFANDTNWKYVVAIFEEKIDILLDFSTVDTINQSGADVKGEMNARKLCSKLLRQFLEEINSYKTTEEIKQPTFK